MELQTAANGGSNRLKRCECLKLWDVSRCFHLQLFWVNSIPAFFDQAAMSSLWRRMGVPVSGLRVTNGAILCLSTLNPQLVARSVKHLLPQVGSEAITCYVFLATIGSGDLCMIIIGREKTQNTSWPLLLDMVTWKSLQFPCKRASPFVVLSY